MVEIDNRKKFVTEAFRTNNIAVVVESSQYFIPYLDVMLKTLIVNSNPSNNYDIIILGNEIDEYDERILKDGYRTYRNVSIRFINPHAIVKSYIEDATHKYLDINYYRLALPWILCRYDKAVQFGADIIIKKDVADLYNVELQDDEYLAGCRDLGYLGRLKMDIPREELGMKKPEDYVNADVLLYNLKRIRDNFILDDVMQVWQKYNLRCSEQDALNLIFDGKIKVLDSRWNVFPRRMVSEMHIACSPEELQKQRQKDLKAPYIVHFAAIPKPWDYPMVEEGITWWEYARQSVYYEEILRRLMIFTIKVETSRLKPPRKRILDVILPFGSSRRKIAKKIAPRGSWLWNLARAVKRGIVRIVSFLKGEKMEEPFGKLGGT